MTKTMAILKLMRWPNLLMIILTQVLLHYMLIVHVFSLVHIDSPLSHLQFFLLMISTVFMAAAGYVFNDVQDVKIDSINKDNKRIIGKEISEQTGMKLSRWFLALSLIPASYLSIQLNMLQLILIHLFIAFGLWYYSTDLKKQVLSGNLLISLFTAFTIAIVWLYHLVSLHNNPSVMIEGRRIIPFINVLVLAISFFAFFISFIREIVKDMEDIEGDKTTDAQTFPVVFGIGKSKTMVLLLSVVMIISTIYAAYYSYGIQLMKLSVYLLVAVLIPLVYLIMNLYQSKNKEDFGDLSTLAKIIMIAGILSIQIFYINY